MKTLKGQACLFATKVFCFYCLVLLIPANALAQPKFGDKVFKMASYTEGSTVAPRVITAHAIRQHIFGKHGYEYAIVSLPSKRMPAALKSGDIDAIAISPRNTLVQGKFFTAKYPDYVYSVSVYYKPSKEWNPSWPPNEEFLKAEGVTKNYNYLRADRFNLYQVARFKSGARMVNAGRAEYWIDVISPRAADYGSLLKLDNDQFRLEHFFDSPLYLMFANTERGKELARIWDLEFPLLLKNVETYTKVYKTGLPPDVKTPILDNYYRYMREKHLEVFQ